MARRETYSSIPTHYHITVQTFKALFAMRLPSSTSLLLASLAVSASSSSSLSALAAPTGDAPEASASPAPSAHCTDGAVARSLGAPIDSAIRLLFSDTATDHLQGRGAAGGGIPPIGSILGTNARAVAGLPRDPQSAADGNSTAGPEPTPASPHPAAVSPPVQPPVKPPVQAQPPAEVPVKPPVQAPFPREVLPAGILPLPTGILSKPPL